MKLQVLVHGGVSYAATLNQSNVCANNNKFYIIQVLTEVANSKNNYFWSRWGRVGVVGQNCLMGPYSSDEAIKQYSRKLKDKSVSGDYTVVEMNYEEDDK